MVRQRSYLWKSALIAVPILNQLIQAVAGGGEVVFDVDVWRSIGIAAIAGGVIALIAFLQNVLEDRTGSDGFLVKKQSSRNP